MRSTDRTRPGGTSAITPRGELTRKQRVAAERKRLWRQEAERQAAARRAARVKVPAAEPEAEPPSWPPEPRKPRTGFRPSGPITNRTRPPGYTEAVR